VTYYQTKNRVRPITGKAISVDVPAVTSLMINDVTEEMALAQLRDAYANTAFEVRFYPSCLTSLRWQIGANGDGQHFRLIAYGSTPGRLLGCLEARCRSQCRNPRPKTA